ncbi:MAG: ABC transporter substrate-binding protein, partial [Flavobacterium sp.]
MKNLNPFLLIIVICSLFIQCKTETPKSQSISAENTVKYAKGFSIENYDGFSIVKVKNPWPKATKTYTYILKEKNGIVPDSLSQNPIINVPIQKIVVTSTTHIPSLEMLDE